MTRTRTAILLAALLALPFAAAVAADPTKEAIEKFEERMDGADEATQVKNIEQFASEHPESEDAAKAISKYINDRSTAVQVAALKAVGSYKDKSYFGHYMGVLKRAEDHPEVMAAALGALGELGDKRAKKELVDIAKKWLPKDSRVASAAIIGIGKIPARENVEELIKLMDLTYPSVAPGSGKTISQETRKTLADSRPAILEALATLTRWDFPDPRAWTRFWEGAGRRWRPGQEEPDLTKIDKWEDPGYGFVIEKPTDKWVFTRPEGTRIAIERGHEGVMQSQVYVQAYDMQNYTSMTAEAKAAELLDRRKQSWKDIKQDSIVRDTARVGRDKGVLQSFTGMDPNGNTMKVREIVVVKDEFMYIIHGWARTGSDETLSSEVEEILESFRFTY